MNENLHNDSLEEFFRKHLENENTLLSEDDGWDVPSDAVWFGVEKRLPQGEEPKRRIIPYWRLVGAVAAVFLVFVFFKWQNYEQQLDKLTKELHHHQEQLDEVKGQLKTSNQNLAEQSKVKSTTEINQQHIQDQGVASQEIVSLGVTSSPKKTKDKVSISFLKNKKLDKTIGSENESILLQEKTVTTPTTKKESLETVISKTTVIREPLYFAELEQRLSYTTFENIPSIKLLTPQLDEKLNLYLQMSDGFGGNIKEVFLPVNSRFYIGVNMAHSYGFRRLKGDENHPRFEKLKEKETAQITMGGGFKFGYQFNDRWSIESGIQYNKLKIKTDHRLSKQYTSDNEVSNDIGELEKNYDILLTTSFGDVVDDLPIARPSNIMIPENLPFDLELKSEQELSIVSVPLLAKFRLGKQRTKFNLKGGMMSSFIVDSGMEVKLVGRPLPFYKPKGRKFEDKKLEINGHKSVTLDLLVGVEAEIKLSKNIYFSLEPTFSQSVTPVFEKDDVKTYPSVASLRVGMNHYF